MKKLLHKLITKKRWIFVKAIIAILIAVPSYSQSWSNTSLGNGWTGVVSTLAAPGNNGGSTTGVDSSTGNLLMFAELDRVDVTAGGCTPTDSVNGGAGNSWTSLTAYIDTATGISHVRWWYVNSNTPNVGINHVVTCTATTIQPVFVFLVAKTGAASPLDQQNGLGPFISSATIQPCAMTPCLTPSQGNELILTYVFANGITISSVDSSFTIVENGQNSTANFAGAVAWITEAGTPNLSPTWTLSGVSGFIASGIVSFKQGSTPSATTRAKIFARGIF